MEPIRLLVSKPAFATAACLLDINDEFGPPPEVRALITGSCLLVCSDTAIAETTGFAVDTIYRAFKELEDLGALQLFGRASANERAVELTLDHWVWSAARYQVDAWTEGQS